MPAELSRKSESSLVPTSQTSSTAPAAITAALCSLDPPLVRVTASGRLTLQVIQSSREFGHVVRALAGKPFRVLCDFTQTLTMPEDVGAVFMRGQEFAVERGMERDAFACTSSVLRLQFVRIARESGRFDRLGPLHFFDTVEQARAYLESPASETRELTSRRAVEHTAGPVSRRDLAAAPASTPLSRRGPPAEHAEGPPRRRSAAFDLSEVASRRAPAIELDAGAVSRQPPPFSLRAAAPSRHRNRG